MTALPFISAMIVARNEECYIEQCFRSLLEQSYPADCYEVLIIDGFSTDKTLDIAKETEAKYAKCIDENNTDTSIKTETKVQIRYFSNPKLSLAAGWNLGIRNAQGDYVIRIDAHAYADKDYLFNSMRTMLSVKDAVCVGGAMNTETLTEKGEIIKEVLSSPFGVGGSKFRYMKEAGYVDTVAFGLYKKEVFERLGYFDEQLERTQDNDMHRRIRADGGKFYLNPEIKTTYYSRDSMSKMMKQGFMNGKWTMINFRRHPGKMAIRHFVPFGFVLSLLGCFALGFFSKSFLVLMLLGIVLHLSVGCYFAFERSKEMSHRLAIPFLFLMLHGSYGIGSLVGVFMPLRRNFSKNC
ncbi:glycosyltransferase family 2 protein [Sporomusa malonica]|uniref:Glycosyltransferase, catalytic subunit of cellulose synthase and poly-beta-1,6-N-acetylglucosamine synthase n=1 Tax=Sporomusa malonica TaxID=112901 RepID=A0A1W1YU82_9FIRM|nr:glycosyltransferase family 2 protein [Sporomusa malonica]SMC39288.1 Glycosyltransferase, catalytic subunit of cellulose synthase and poly-beta-1,6-N-acetylglucosamine synthase [Sporomusa malonica]